MIKDLVITSQDSVQPDLPGRTPYTLKPPISSGGYPFTTAPPHSSKRFKTGTGIFACFPSITPFGLTLGAD